MLDVLYCSPRSRYSQIEIENDHRSNTVWQQKGKSRHSD